MIPPTLTILERVYTVSVQAMQGDLGACCNATQDITIDGSMHPQTQDSVLLHEVIEAINASMGLGIPHRTIDALETGLYGVLQANGWWGHDPS